MAPTMFLSNARDGTCTSYYMRNTWFDTLGRGELLRLYDIISTVFKYLWLFRIAIRIGNDPVLTVLEIN